MAIKPTHNLSATTSTYQKWTETKYRNTDFWTLFLNEEKNTMTIKLSDVMTNVLRTALWIDFEWWINVRPIKPKDEEKAKTVIEEDKDDLPF